VRTFLDANGRTVASGFDQYKDQVVPNVLGHTITVTPGSSAIVDRADTTAMDREYFRHHPDHSAYERDALPVELEQARFSPDFRPKSGRVRVRQLAPGVRVRELVETSE
jgi:hypothetical protein